MTDEEITKLALAIKVAMTGSLEPEQKEPEQKEPEQKEPEQKEPEQKEPEQDQTEIKTFIEGLVKELGDGLKESIQASNRQGARQPEPESADQILASIISPPKKKEE